MIFWRYKVEFFWCLINYPFTNRVYEIPSGGTTRVGYIASNREMVCDSKTAWGPWIRDPVNSEMHVRLDDHSDVDAMLDVMLSSAMLIEMDDTSGYRTYSAVAACVEMMS